MFFSFFNFHFLFIYFLVRFCFIIFAIKCLIFHWLGKKKLIKSLRKQQKEERKEKLTNSFQVAINNRERKDRKLTLVNYLPKKIELAKHSIQTLTFTNLLLI